MGRIRKTLAWTFSPGGNMKGPIRAESSAERAAREAAEAQKAQADEHRRLLEEQNRLLAAVARSATNTATKSEPETLIRLSCGHTAVIADPRTARWLAVEGDISYHCRTCNADRPVIAIGEDPTAMPSSSGGQLSGRMSGQLADELERLAGLHASGALTDAEFQAAKGRLLGL
jgi:Short C-terminal domain